MKLLDLFSGIGGFSLGLERAGFETVAFCEIDPFCRAVLAKHWPQVPRYDDVRTLDADRLAADGIAVEIISAGFPCQDISRAGKRDGLAGERSGLWSEVARLTGELRPRYLVLENVPELLVRGMERVLGDLAAIGYDAEWDGLPAAAFGSPQLRAREWILAYPACVGDGLAPRAIQAGRDNARICAWWNTEPGMGRVVDGVPSRLDRARLGVLGNTILPQIAERIGCRVMAHERGIASRTCPYCAGRTDEEKRAQCRQACFGGPPSGPLQDKNDG